MSSFRWGIIACPAQRNSQVTGREAETPPVFIPLKQCFAYCFAHWRSPGVCILPSSFWSITLKCLDADQSTIPNMKGDILSFHMMHRSMICSKRLQRNSIRIPIEESYLVCKGPEAQTPKFVLLIQMLVVCLSCIERSVQMYIQREASPWRHLHLHNLI